MSKTTIKLTVTESKRLIAKGVLSTKSVLQALRNGRIFLCYGTTNAYIAEELIPGFNKKSYVTGKTLPFKNTVSSEIDAKEKAIIIEKGEVKRVGSINDEFANISAGDVILKGANAVSHDLDKAAILIGHHTSGTIGAFVGPAIARRAYVIHPVGLEKVIPADLDYMAAKGAALDCQGPALWVSPGAVFTELDALETLVPGITAYPYAAGGVGGAEGGQYLLVEGKGEQIVELEKVILGIRGEAPFI